MSTHPIESDAKKILRKALSYYNESSQVWHRLVNKNRHELPVQEALLLFVIVQYLFDVFSFSSQFLYHFARRPEKGEAYFQSISL